MPGIKLCLFKDQWCPWDSQYRSHSVSESSEWSVFFIPRNVLISFKQAAKRLSTSVRFIDAILYRLPTHLLPQTQTHLSTLPTLCPLIPHLFFFYTCFLVYKECIQLTLISKIHSLMKRERDLQFCFDIEMTRTVQSKLLTNNSANLGANSD